MDQLHSIVAESSRLLGLRGIEPASDALAVLVDCPDQEEAARKIVGALLAGRHLVLASDEWDAKWKAEARMIANDLVTVAPWIDYLDEPVILVPTGGSDGGLRFCVHTWTSLTAGAKAFLRFFGEVEHYAICVLPMHHVSGLMQLIRCLHAPGILHFAHYANLPNEGILESSPTGIRWFLSLVPTQLRRLTADPEALKVLKRMHCIPLGGAPAASPDLDQAREQGLNLAPCYGMTESAGMVTAYTPEDFKAGAAGVGRVLPHANIFIRTDSGLPAEPGVEGTIIIQAKSLFRGYIPGDPIEPQAGFASSDSGFFDRLRNLRITGRTDSVIVTGGEKVAPADVERAILDTDWVEDCYVAGKADEEWGERVVAFVVRFRGAPEDRIIEKANSSLASYQRPKRWIFLDTLPRNVVGKIQREKLPWDSA